MLQHRVPMLAVEVQLLVAGVGLQIALQHLLNWRRGAARRVSGWLGALCVTLSAVLIANVWVFHASSGQVGAALLTRATLIFMAIALLVPTVAALSGQRSPRLGMGVLIALGLVRLVLWVTSDLVYGHRLSPLGLPVNGGLFVVTAIPPLLLAVGLAVRSALRWNDPTERLIVVIGLGVEFAVVVLALAKNDQLVGQLLAGYLAIPPIVALQIVSSRRVALANEDERHQATHDALTGLLNRGALVSRLSDSLRESAGFSLVVMDLDGFKDVNDTLGHSVGDEVLTVVAGRLASSLCDHDVVARLGGDEFGVVVADAEADVQEVATALLRLLDDPVEIDGVDICIRASIGTVRAPDDGLDADTLLRRADSAMYKAKRRGTTVYAYAAGDDEGAPRRLQLAGRLPAALLSPEIEVHFQPIIDLVEGRCGTLEALVRWHHPDWGMILPAEFIPLAEQYGLAIALFARVTADALRLCASWREQGLARSVTVNVSPRTLVDPTFPGCVTSELARVGLPAEALVLEMTENAFVEEQAAVRQVLAWLDELGVRVAIDDFGTGYSSLAYLRRLPVRMLKLDRTFTAGLDSDSTNEAIVGLTLGLGRSLGLTVVAEGVETPEELDALRRRGCDLAQGYWICPPMAAVATTRWLSANAAHPVLTPWRSLRRKLT